MILTWTMMFNLYHQEYSISNLMKKSIYIQLLDEGTKVYRPVPALEIEQNVYKLEGFEMYDPENETWEFLPGTCVLVEEQRLEGGVFLVAIKSKEL